MKVIVTSTQDIAGQTIKEVLLDKYDFVEADQLFEGNKVYKYDKDVLLISTTSDSIHADHLDDFFAPEIYIFATRHRSEAGIPALLIHSTGNWTEEALVGGNPEELAIASAFSIKVGLLELLEQKKRLKLDNYAVSMEVSHHGPTSLSHPLLFVECGSSEEQWTDKKACEAVAHAVMQIASAKLDELDYIPAIGFGGPHYAPHFSELVKRSEFATSHIAPKYVFSPNLKKKMVRQAIRKTHEKIDHAILDWKGLKKEHKDFLIPLLRENGLEIERISRIK